MMSPNVYGLFAFYTQMRSAPLCELGVLLASSVSGLPDFGRGDLTEVVALSSAIKAAQTAHSIELTVTQRIQKSSLG
jgi:hypothetical protein